MSRLGPVLLCGLICCAGLGGGLLAAEPKGSTAAAIFPPWWPAGQSLAAAASAGDVRSTGALPFVFIVQSQYPGLNERLHAAGALLLLSPLGQTGCAQPSAKKQNV